MSNANSYGVATNRDTVRIERLLPGPIERLWKYLTDSGKRGQWLAKGKMELHVGGSVEHLFDNSQLTEIDDPPPSKYAEHSKPMRMQGKVTACEPPRLLSYLWGGTGPDASEVTFELATKGEMVQLIVTHRRLPNRDQMISVAAGWHAHLGILEDHLNDRIPPGFWKTHTSLEAEYEQLIPKETAEACLS